MMGMDNDWDAEAILEVKSTEEQIRKSREDSRGFGLAAVLLHLHQRATTFLGSPAWRRKSPAKYAYAR